MKPAIVIISAFFWLLIVLCSPDFSSGMERPLPNILWIVSEDNSPFAGIYGDEFATTPHMDKLASEGFWYSQAHANAPVCAPARNTIITGVYANSGGHQHMRSNYEASDIIRFFPMYLRDAGYYATNNAKEDYNLAIHQTREIWDESSNRAHYKNRAPGQPFFAVFNSALSHEGRIHTRIPAAELYHDPQKVTIPPYLPDTPDIRHDLAQYYDHIRHMDQWIGEVLQELEESGEADNTIVFYYGDHGGVYPRSKRYVYETGTRVPFIVRIPEKFRDLWPSGQPGSRIDRPVSFVDLAPTLLSIAGIPIPGFMQGKAFLGEQKTCDPEYVFMFRGRMDERYDMSRAVKDRQYRYIRNYMPYRIYGQRLDYLWRAPSMRSWEETCKTGGCTIIQNKFWNPKPVEELYDTLNDPWEIHNLATEPAASEILERMRKANLEWMTRIKDTGFIPEAELAVRAGGMPIYDYMRSGTFDLHEIIEAAELATRASPRDIPVLKTYLQSDDSAIRFWGVSGLMMIGEEARAYIPHLKKMLHDPSPNVVVVASEALYLLDEKKEARKGFIHALQADNPFARTHALNAIDSVDDSSLEVRQAVIGMARKAEELTRQHYDHRAAKVLLDKWEISPEKHGIKISW